MATRDTYTKVHEDWMDKPNSITPILADDLEHIESGIKEAKDNRALKDIYGDDHMNLQASEHSMIKATGSGSLVHGTGSCAPNPQSYSGGVQLTNTGYCSHAEGSTNTINGGYSVHAEGNSNTTNGSSYAHVEGDNNTVNGSANAHAEGVSNTLNGNNPSSHIEGEHNNIYPTGSESRAVHVEGSYNDSRGSNSHIEGYYNKEYVTSNYYQANHLEGSNNELYTNNGYGAHIEGHNNHAGTSSKYAGSYMHMEGYENIGYGQGSHIEGYSNEEGTSSTSENNQCNHVEGGDNVLSGSNRYAHVSGFYNKSTGVEGGAVYGYQNTLSGNYQFVCGRYNEADPDKALIVGGGSYSSNKNILTLDWNGNLVLAGGVQLKGNAQIEGDVQIALNSRTISLFGLQMEVEGRAKGLQSQIDTLRGQAATAKVFETKAALDEWLAAEGNSETLTIGQNIYIVAIGTPDYWWDGEKLQVLETDEVTIETMTYEEAMAILDSENDNGEAY